MSSAKCFTNHLERIFFHSYFIEHMQEWHALNSKRHFFVLLKASRIACWCCAILWPLCFPVIYMLISTLITMFNYGICRLLNCLGLLSNNCKKKCCKWHRIRNVITKLSVSYKQPKLGFVYLHVIYTHFMFT